MTLISKKQPKVTKKVSFTMATRVELGCWKRSDSKHTHNKLLTLLPQQDFTKLTEANVNVISQKISIVL